MEKVAVSIIIASYNSIKTIAKCLTSLEAQDTRDVFEIIVVDSSTDGTDSLVKQQFPSVSLYHFDTRMYPGDARNYGVVRSKGSVLAFIDSDCWVESTWVAQIIETHGKTEYPVVGGAIANGNPDSYIGWGYYFSGLSQWMPQPQAFERTDIPTGCLSCKRWAFEQYGPFLEGSLCEDTLFTWKLADAGHLALFVPTIKVFHINIDNLGNLIRRKLIHGKTFAMLRVSKRNFSVSKQIIYAVGSLILPLLILYRRTKDVFNAKTYWVEYIQALPVTFIGILCWSIGEFLGYSEGRKSS